MLMLINNTINLRTL